MKKIAIIISDVVRTFKIRRIAAILRRINELNEDINLYIFRGLSVSCMSEDYNIGEYNIYRLPDFSDFDGIIMDMNNIKTDAKNSSGANAYEYVKEQLRKSGKPVISIANDIDDFYFVGIDNRSSMRSMISHLHTVHQCKKFWFVMAPKEYYEIKNRVQGLLDYLDEQHLPYDESDFYYESYEYQCGLNSFEALLNTHTTLPDAIICANDTIALGVCEQAKKCGYHIPQDFIVTGFDNNNKAAIYSPGITTVNQTEGDTGYQVVDTMLRIWNNTPVPHTNYAKTSCIFRESCGCHSVHNNDLEKFINKQIHADVTDTEYTEQMKSLNYDLVHCKSIYDICRIVSERISVMKDISLYLVLDKNINEFNETTEINEYLMASKNQFHTNGYPEQMDLVFAYEKGEILDIDATEIKGLFPTFESKISGTNFMFIPLHFGRYTVGYFVVKNGLCLMEDRYLTNVLNTISTTIENFYYKNQLTYANDMLSRLYIRDSMTGLFNRLGYQKKANPLFNRHKAMNENLTILFIDMDRLKYINDTYGHEYGDFAIRIISSSILHNCPEHTISVRWGGDEFLSIMPMLTPTELKDLEMNIRNEIIEHAQKIYFPCELTVSIGCTNTDVTTNMSLDDYVQEADEDMYKEKIQKKSRRN